VIEQDGGFIGIVLRSARGVPSRVGMCSLCLTVHPGDGVALMTAQKAGDAGRKGDSVGIPICTDLACSLYVRQKKRTMLGGRLSETIPVDDQIARIRRTLIAFIANVSDR
jgi:hypothetical protein